MMAASKPTSSFFFFVLLFFSLPDFLGPYLMFWAVSLLTYNLITIGPSSLLLPPPPGCCSLGILRLNFFSFNSLLYPLILFDLSTFIDFTLNQLSRSSFSFSLLLTVPQIILLHYSVRSLSSPDHQ